MAESSQQGQENGQERISGVEQWGDYIAAMNAFKAIASNIHRPPDKSKALAPATNAPVPRPGKLAVPALAPTDAPVRTLSAPAEAEPSLHVLSNASRAVTTSNEAVSDQEASGASSLAAISPSEGMTPRLSSVATANDTSSLKMEGERAEASQTPAGDSNKAQHSQLTGKYLLWNTYMLCEPQLKSHYNLAGGSDGSDEVVFRQDELRMVGPNIPYGFRKNETLKAPKSVGQIKMNYPQEQENNDNHPPHRRRPSRGRNYRKHNAPARSIHKQGSETNGVVLKAPVTAIDRIKEAAKAELLEFQKKEMERYGKKVMGLLPEESPESIALSLARQGPGVDPDSIFCKQHPLYLLTDLAESLKTQTDEAQGRLERGDARSIDDDQQSGPAMNEWALGNTASAVAVDWQYRPWEKYGDEFFAQKFRNWLDKTMRVGFIVDMTQEEFRNGEYHANLDTGMGPSTFVCPETLRDISDPETLKHAHETAIGYVHNWNLRIRQEEERKEAEQQQRKLLAIMPKSDSAFNEPKSLEPKLNMYIRPVEPKDIIALVELFNWYVKNTVRRADTEEISFDEMREHVEELQRDNYPFIVAVQRHPRAWHAMNHEAEMLYGFCCISDFTGPLSTQRFSYDLEVFVHPKNFKQGVASCLLDKMLEICDPKYSARGGYIFDCSSRGKDVYTCGLSRPAMRLCAVVHHSDEEFAEYTWIKEWLGKKFGFEEQGYLGGFGVSKKALVNAGYMVYSTGIDIPESE
ncbi:conserved hypothetical protein [Trichophyton verrucosum HKI 0517]|uniref:N-acetyltransferase domain-containing protein n=1 Tax=Trichophyton verrucosum (strain HKI 0517) TaxID=663202 RepID=D4DIY1_TRIVH|nr:uncharacterized protein TRV_07144 [Trichophyton verrucosum HKI 0517]EFE38180.1 conserved hypothetical protein [Trichophyton verrucosum HKI 0517]